MNEETLIGEMLIPLAYQALVCENGMNEKTPYYCDGKSSGVQISRTAMKEAIASALCQNGKSNIKKLEPIINSITGLVSGVSDNQSVVNWVNKLMKNEE